MIRFRILKKIVFQYFIEQLDLHVVLILRNDIFCIL